MAHILLTGATGVLGRRVRSRLIDQGHTVRVLSRRDRPEHEDRETWIKGDLRANTAVDAAVRDVEVVVHCASGKSDVDATRHLLEAASAANVKHIVYISIVGVDAIPFSYYRSKRECEELIERSGIPFTILRATQFHDFVESFFVAQRVSPFLLTLGFSLQPVDVDDVADRLVELAVGSPRGRVDDLGGPDVLTGIELGRAFLSANKRRRAVIPVSLPGATFGAFKRGDATSPQHRSHGRRFEEYLRDRARERAEERRERAEERQKRRERS